jgi:EmrB/QacA subfamily drug resistance transporter
MTASPRRAVIALTGAALFMIVLDNLIVLATLPSIQRSMHASLASLEWVVDAYILSFAVLMLTGAALGERFGRRRVFGLGLGVFTAASAVAGFATTPEVLVAARVVQGMGAAVVMPLTLTLLSAAFPPERRAAAIGIWGAISGLGVALGPIAGGLLTSALSWHWIFWVNVPVGAAVIALAPRLLAESRGRREALDHVGLLLVSGGLLGLVWATVRGNAAGWGAPQTVGAYAAGIVLLVAFVLQELRAAQPMLPMRLFADRRFSTANAAAFMLHFAMFGTFFLVVEFLARFRHEGPVMAGVWTLPWTLMPMLVSPLAGRLARRFHPATTTAVGLGLIGAGIGALAVLVSPSTGPAALVLPLWTIGIGIGLSIPSVVAIAMSSAPAADIGKASGTLSTARQLGSVFGIAVPGAIFQAAGAAGTSGLTAALTATAAAAALGAVLSLSLVPRVVELSRLRLATSS